MPRVDITVERLDEVWSTLRPMLQREFDEYKDLLGLWKPHRPDIALLRLMEKQNMLQITTARVDNELAGCLMMVFDTDVESAGERIIRQGPFFVDSKWAHLGLGAKMLRRVLDTLRTSISAPVDLDLHHPPVGRGAKLESLFTSLGAAPVAIHYRLKVSPDA